MTLRRIILSLASIGFSLGFGAGPGGRSAQAALPNWASCSADAQCSSQRCGCNGGTVALCLPNADYPKTCKAAEPADAWIPGPVPGAQPFVPMTLTGSYQFAAGVYQTFATTPAIVVNADNVTIDGNGMTLYGAGGLGIVINGHVGVRVRGFKLRGFRYAVRAINSQQLTIEGNDLSDNARSDGTFLDINAPVAQTPGGAILFESVTNSVLQDNTAHRVDTGANLYDSRGNLVQGNDFSKNSAWGVRLFRSTENRVLNNRLDHVNRCQGTGCDSAAILMVKGSNRNTIAGNDLTYSGDGFFIGNEHGEPSEQNLISGNDGSYSPNNCFEATFSGSNRFLNNIAKGCNYGFWLGFSFDNLVQGNVISENRVDGINADHARRMRFVQNTVEQNQRYGITITLSDSPALVAKYPGSESSPGNHVYGNTFGGNGQNTAYAPGVQVSATE